MNAKIGSDNTDREKAMGSQGCGTINNNGEILVNFCLNNNCVIGGTIFQHKDIHKLTWKSPDGKIVNQIDQERLQLEYSIKDKEIKKSARHKRAHVDNIAMNVETAAERGEISTVYRLTKQLCRHTKTSVSIVKDKEGNHLTTEET